MHHSWMNRLSRWRVRVAWMALLLVLVLSKPTLRSLLAGILLALLALGIRTWASGHLNKEKELAISGPYRYTRNPLYLGNFILGLSFVVGSWSLWVLAVFSAYFLLFYPPVIKKERLRMKELFPKKYEEYKEKVPPFFPSLKHQPSSQLEKFSWKLYKRNKEYRALAGTALFWLVVAVKFLLLKP